jgi:Domain of unknown function (DUF4351)
LLKDLNLLVPADEKELRRIFDIWLDHRFRRYPFGAIIPKGKITLGSATMLDETFREWEQKIRQQERREMQKLVLEMLQQRFGPIPQGVRQRLKEISAASELRKLGRRILTANSLQETGLV